MAQPSILELTGRIDNVTSAAVEAQINAALDAAPSALVINCAGISFVSSVGLRVLLMAAKRCQKQKAKLALYAVAPHIAELFGLSGLQTFLPTYADQAAALAAVA